MSEKHDPAMDLVAELERTLTASRHMVAFWRVEEGKIRLWRRTENFPVADFGAALDLLRAELEREGDSLQIGTGSPAPAVEPKVKPKPEPPAQELYSSVPPS
ncbi:MAG: hypothetical protein JO112_12130 [Planctomycetes bacterium]|nr:hypothetical protein [Planctomycetota bacterium]